MRRVFSHILALIALVLIGAALPSCEKAVPLIQHPEKQDVVKAWLSLDLDVLSSGAATKAAAEVPGGDNKGIDENTIKSLVIWLVPAPGGVEKWSETVMTHVSHLALTSGDNYLASVQTMLNVPMNVYVGANLSTNIADAFLAGGPNTVYSAAVSADYPEMVADLASADRGVAMFCVKKTGVTFTTAHLDKSTPAEASIELVRMLAKVHVLFQCYDSPNDGYVRITHPGSMTPADFGEFGWSKLEDISYIVNTVNKTTQIFQPAYSSGPDYSLYKDLNHSMTDLLQKGLEWDYKAGADVNFLGFAEDLSGDHETTWTKWSAKPEKYIVNKAPFGTCTDGSYVQGLYCMENTTDNSAVALMTSDEAKFVPFMVATHVIVKARFVPRVIKKVVSGVLVDVDYGVDRYDLALAALPEVVGEDENGDPHTYPAGTFFTRDMKNFYDYYGMLKLIETEPGLTRKNFAAYPGGYGFYYSYIHGGQDVTTGQVTFNGEQSGVFRNHYHILSCSLMKVPATPGSFDQLMMVNSKVVDWNPKGALNLIVKPSL